MYKIDIVKAVITQYINDKLVRRKIICKIKSSNNIMYCFDQARLAAVILYYTIANMPDGTDSKNDLKIWIEPRKTSHCFFHHENDRLYVEHFFSKPLRRCTVTISNTITSLQTCFLRNFS